MGEYALPFKPFTMYEEDGCPVENETGTWMSNCCFDIFRRYGQSNDPAKVVASGESKCNCSSVLKCANNRASSKVCCLTECKCGENCNCSAAISQDGCMCKRSCCYGGCKCGEGCARISETPCFCIQPSTNVQKEHFFDTDSELNINLWEHNRYSASNESITFAVVHMHGHGNTEPAFSENSNSSM